MSVGKRQDWLEGEERAWEKLSRLAPEDVCRRARTHFDELAGCHVLPMFNQKVFISPKERKIWGHSQVAELVLNRIPHLSRLPVLWYLIEARDIPLSGKLVNPRDLDGGLIFARGSHILPLHKIVDKYCNDVDGFLQRSATLGGKQLNYGDHSIRLFPFPRVPVVLILWEEDNEFPARADILFDSTCSIHLPTDIIWSTAMMTIFAMLS